MEITELDKDYLEAKELIGNTAYLFNVMMDAVGDGVSIQDINMRIVYQNKAMIELMGSHKGEFCYSIYERRAEICEGCPIQLAYKDGSVHKAIRVGILPDGTTRRFENVASVLRNKEGNIVAGIEVVRDVEENERNKEDLVAINKELDSFTHIVAHDLKEPLRMVANYMQLFEKRYRGALDERADKYINYAVGGAKRMQTLIDDLLSLSRISRLRNAYESVDSEKLIHDAIRRLTHVIEEKNVNVVIDDKLPIMYCDPIKMREVMYNLISNAIKYNDNPNPKIEIKAENYGTIQNNVMIVFSIKDNGIGIREDHFDSIFEIFRRFHGHEEYGGGTGIGLAIVKKVIDDHKGEIWVESKEGKGSAFFFKLPTGCNKMLN